MKTLGYSLFVLVVVIFLSSGKTNLSAQQVSSDLEEDYSRPSVTFFITRFSGDNLSQKAVKAANEIPISDKYFNHNLDKIHIDLDQSFKSLSFEDKKKKLTDYFRKNRIGAAMIAKWFNRQPDGMFNLSYIHECGMYDASDQDVLMSNAAKRGEAVLQDAGQNLVNKTYVLVIAPKEFTSFDNEQSHGWNSMYDVFLFKLNFDPEDIDRFYSIWPFEDDPPEVRQQKIASFDTISFSFRYMYGKQGLVSNTTELYVLTDDPKSSDQLFNETVVKMYDNALFNIDKDLEAFRVKVSVSGTRPIRAKIGKKEGLRCDQRYFVYEFVWNEETNQAEEDRKAVVRATGKIVDNRKIATGSSKESRFYQVYGGTIRQGMVMQQRNDLGISLTPGFEIGGIGGGSVGMWIRTGFFTNVPMLYVMGDVGFDAGDFDPYEAGSEDNYSFFRFSVGMGKGIRMGRIVELVPYAGWGMESTSNDSLSMIRTTLIKAGGALSINITPGIALLGQLNFYVPYAGIETKIDEEDAVREEQVWTDRFKDRSGMSILAGLRFEF